MIISYADDENKKHKIVDYIRENPGARTHQICNSLSMGHRAYQKLSKELKNSNTITVKLGDRGAQLHYCN